MQVPVQSPVPLFSTRHKKGGKLALFSRFKIGQKIVMDKKWDVNPSKSLAGMKKPNDQAEATKVDR